MSLQNRIKLLREEKDLTQKELAAYLQVDRATISGYETKGKQPDVEKLTKIAKIFEVSLDYLINGVEINDQFDITVTTEQEHLMDENIYQIYSQLNYHYKREVQQFMRYLHYRQIRPNDND